MATTTNPLETSLKNIGFTEDANAAETETASAGAAATEEAEIQDTEETAETETSEETREEESTEETSEAEESSEATEEGGEAAEEAEPQGYDVMLPDKQLKSYPEELYQLAAKKFGVDPSTLDQAGQRSLLKGKIDSDIDNRNLRERLEALEDQDEDVLTDEEEESTGGQRGETEMVTPARQLEATFNLLRGGLDGQTPIITKEGAKIYSDAMMGSYTEMQEAIDSGDAKKIEAANMKFAETQAAFATVMFANVFPALLPHMIQQLPEQVWDGIVGAKLEQREEMKETHSTARAQLLKDPRYSDLGEMIKSKAIYNFVRENPEVMEKRFKDVNGNLISDPIKLEMARYRYVVHQIRGQNYRPPTELVKKGMEAGKRNANELQRKKDLGRLATGKSRGSLNSTSADRYDPKNWADRMKKAADSANPLGAWLDQQK